MPKLCENCGEREGVDNWVGTASEMEIATGRVKPVKWCRICVLEAQIEHAKEGASHLPSWRAQLRVERGEVATMAEALALEPDPLSVYPDEAKTTVKNKEEG